MDDYAIQKRLVFFKEDDYEKASANERIVSSALKFDPANMMIVLSEDYNDAQCPVCKCFTISNIVDEYTNRFIFECVACKTRFDSVIV